MGGDYQQERKVSTPTTPKVQEYLHQSQFITHNQPIQQQRTVEAQRQIRVSPSHNIKNRPATGFPQQVPPRPPPVSPTPHDHYSV